jgi:hypothetical protein
MTRLKVKASYNIIGLLKIILGFAQVVCDNDELFNALIDQLALPEVHEGIKSNLFTFLIILFIELAYIYKLKLRECWTGVLSSFNEIISDLDISQVMNMFEQDEIVIEALSVRIDMISHKPEFKTAKKSIKHILKRFKDRVNKEK